MFLMEKEIYEQPETLLNAAAKNAAVIEAVAAKAKASGVTNIIGAARGSSDNALNYFKYLCEVYAGLPVGFAAPSVFTLYNGKLSQKGCLVIGVSQSGRAADVLAVLESAKKDGAVTLAVTNNPDSPVARCAEFHIDLDCGEEKSVAATKTMTAQMYVLSLLAAELSGSAELKKELELVPALSEKVIAERAGTAAAAAAYEKAGECYILARGYAYAAAQEAGLKIQETCYVRARSFAISDFHHGPFAVLDGTSRVIILAPSGETEKDALEMAEKVRGTGADLTVFAGSGVKIPANRTVNIPECPETAAPILMVIAAQLFALELSTKRGLNPDVPRGLKKVTITK